MKTNFITIITKIYFWAMILISCESQEQNIDGAFNHVKEEKMLTGDSNGFNNEIIKKRWKREIIKNNSSQNVTNMQENMSEWTKFKIETEKKILINEKRIKDIKGIPVTNSKLIRNVLSLEKDNNDLRRQMDEYNEEVKLKWEIFKAKINHDVNKIGIELKDISINNKK